MSVKRAIQQSFLRNSHADILLGSCPEDMVLDSFSGSRTTGSVAEELHRKAVLIEIDDQ